MEVREANFKYLFVYFSSPEIFWGLQLAINSFIFTAKAQNEQGILLFVHWKLAQGLSNKRFDLYESYIFQVRFVLLQCVILCQLAHKVCHPSCSTKTKGQHFNYTKTKHCMSLMVSVINYAHKVCCEHVITFVPRITMEGRICVPRQGNKYHQRYVFPGQEKHISLGICVSWIAEHISLGILICFLGRETHVTGICASQVGDHISLGICVSWVGIVSLCHDFILL